MILTDREIQTFINNRQIYIEPKPDVTRYSSTSVDLTLARELLLFNETTEQLRETITLGDKFKYNEFKDRHTKGAKITSKGHTLKPKEFVLAWTQEKITLPNESRVAARVEGKSSLARVGLAIHVTAPTIHAGFKGYIQLELCNHGPVNICITPGIPICQLIFEMTLGTPAKGYSGKFHEQRK